MELEFDSSLLRPTKEFNLYINVAMTNNEWSGLKYIELIPDEKSLLTYNLLQHRFTSLFLSIGPKDDLLFLHPHNCRTHKHILWACYQGKLINKNGKVVKFITKAEFDAEPQKNGVEAVSEAELLPTVKDTGTLVSTKFEFKGDFMTFTVGGETYNLRAETFPTSSYLKQGSPGPRYRFKAKSSGIVHYTYYG